MMNLSWWLSSLFICFFAYAYVSYDMYNHSVAGFQLLSACDDGRRFLRFSKYTTGGADPCFKYSIKLLIIKWWKRWFNKF